MPEAVLVFIAPPDPAALRERLEGRGTDDAEAIAERLRTAQIELDAQQEFQHVVCNDDLEHAAADELEPIVRDELGRRVADRGRSYTPAPMIKPRVDELLERTDSHYAAVLVAAKRARQLNSYYRALGEGSYEEYTPPMVETPDRQLPDDRARGARPGQDRVPLPGLAPAATPGTSASARPYTAPAPRVRSGHGPDPAWRERRDRRLQGARARPPGDQGRARRPRADDARRRALRRRRVVRGHRRRAGPQSTSSSATRCAAPSRATRRPTHDPIGHLAAGGERRRLPGRAGLGEHARQARGRDLRLDARPPRSSPARRRARSRRR